MLKYVKIKCLGVWFVMFIERKNYLDRIISFKGKKIIKVITGIRRCGKSTILRMYKDWLIENGVNANQIIWVNLDSLEFEDLRNYRALYEHIKALMVENKMNYIIIDEVQECEQFQKVVDSLFLMDNADIYITGSNAHLLSGELATFLSGRYVTIEMLPLSFKEFVDGIELNGESVADKASVFRQYLKYGSLPFVLSLGSDEERVFTYLEGIYNTIFIKDVVSRNKITNQQMLEDLTKFCFDNVGNITSSKKISDTMTSFNRKITTPTVENYLGYLKDCYLIYKVDRYDIKGKMYLKSLSKYYVADLGLRNYLLGYKDLDRGHILENVVYLEILRRGFKVYIGKVDDMEVDFVAVKGSEVVYVQVAETIRDEQIFEREMRPLRQINDFNRRVVITSDYDINESYNGIKHLNVIDFLLDENCI